MPILNTTTVRNVTQTGVETISEHNITQTDNRPTAVPNDLRLLMLMRNQAQVKQESVQNHKSHAFVSHLI